MASLAIFFSPYKLNLITSAQNVKNQENSKPKAWEPSQYWKGLWTRSINSGVGSNLGVYLAMICHIKSIDLVKQWSQASRFREIKLYPVLQYVFESFCILYDSLAILVSQLEMGESLERLREAAQAGNIDALYAVIQDDADVFQRFDQMKFVDTPLHIAAAAGYTDFAMEIMNLNPSFSKKLNPRGLSPIHLALQNQQTAMVIDLLSIDKDLVRVKRREGYTPVHIVARDGNVPLLSQFLEQCPDCILDLTIRKETALHIAAQNNRLEALKAMLQFIQRGTIFDYQNQTQKKRILNLQDKDGNTILHIAASNSQPQMFELLIKCKGIDRNMINGKGSTALKVLQEQTHVDNRGSTVNSLRRAEYSWSRCFEVSRFGTTLVRDVSEMKPETINALLVVFALILTMTYPALLSPPRGLVQGDRDDYGGSQNVGESAMKSFGFLLFFIPNGVAFLLAWSLTLVLLSLVAKIIMSFVFPLYLLMWFCYGAAVYAIAPRGFSGFIAGSFPSISIVLIHHLAFYRFKK